MGECFILNRRFINEKMKDISPKKLGYTDDCKYFFDGEYCGEDGDTKAKDINIWYNIGTAKNVHFVRYKPMFGGHDLSKNSIITKAGANSAMVLRDENGSIVPLQETSFTLEGSVRILPNASKYNSYASIFANFQGAGIGFDIYRNGVNINMHNGSDYQRYTYNHWSSQSAIEPLNVYLAMAYNSETKECNYYQSANGVLTTIVKTGMNYKSSPYAFCFGGNPTSSNIQEPGLEETDGEFEAYRIAYYDRALTSEEINKHYEIDQSRISDI